MKWKFLLQIFCMAFVIALFSECKYGPDGIPGPGELPDPDEDSDRPAWAGGKTGENPHNKKPDDGTMGGTKDYGDMIVIKRDGNGVPEMLEFDEYDEEGNVIGSFWVYQPLDAAGELIDLDDYGEVPEGAPVVEVDFGRLNIIRSPESVLNQALGEVLTAMKDATKFSQDFCGRLSIWKYVDLLDENGEPVLDNEGNPIQVEQITKTIDSPRESMAIYREIMKNEGSWGALSALDGYMNPVDLAAASFSAGSDKTGTVDIDEVEYVNGMMKIGGSLDYCEDQKLYFDFSGFHYDRAATYENRWLNFYNYVNGEYELWKTESVLQVMEDNGLFRYRYDGSASNVDGFACAVDDAVQVLEFVHGNSNIEFVPDYVPPVTP